MRPSLLYRDISEDITEHDENVDAEEWSYSGITVYRGSLDMSYKDHNVDVYSLYSEDLRRIGIAEHDSDDHSIFNSLFFYETPFGTLMQEPGWKSSEKTVWSLMSPEAYQDYADTEFNKIILKAEGVLIPLSFLISGIPDVYECLECGKKSFSPITCVSVKKSKLVLYSNPYFIDESFIIYIPPNNTTVWSRLGLQQPASYEARCESPKETKKHSDLPETEHLLTELPQEFLPPHELQSPHPL